MSRRTVMSTMWGGSPRWREQVEFYRPEKQGTLRDHWRLWRMARGKEAVILFGAVSLRTHRYRDLVFAALLKLRPGPRPRVLITDATWETESKALSRLTGLPPEAFGFIAKGIIRLIDGPHVRYGVLSSDELETFPKTWGVDPERVVFTPFPATIDPETPTSDEGYVFAGGNSLRDYDLLDEAIGDDGPPTKIAATWSPERPRPTLETGPVPHEDFVDLLSGCTASVVPLEQSVRSAGQQSYLNAMMLGKPTIVTEAPGVRDYIEDGVTGIIVPPEPEALREAIEDVMDPANAERNAEMGRRARESVLENFTPEAYKDEILLEAIGLPQGEDDPPADRTDARTGAQTPE